MEAAAHARRWKRIGPPAFLTILIILLPVVGARLSYRFYGEPVEQDLVNGGVLTAAAMAALAWAGLALYKIVGRMNMMAVGATRGGGVSLTDPALIEPILAAHDLPCVRCGYNLRGLPGGACPECREPIMLTIAGSDPLRPIVWLTRLSVVVYAISALPGLWGMWWAVQRWPGVFFMYPGISMLRARVALMLHPVVCVLGLLLLGL